MDQNKANKDEKIQPLTRNQVLQYIAEMSEQMSQLASKADCTDLAKSLKIAANQANHQLPRGFED